MRLPRMKTRIFSEGVGFFHGIFEDWKILNFEYVLSRKVFSPRCKPVSVLNTQPPPHSGALCFLCSRGCIRPRLFLRQEGVNFLHFFPTDWSNQSILKTHFVTQWIFQNDSTREWKFPTNFFKRIAPRIRRNSDSLNPLPQVLWFLFVGFRFCPLDFIAFMEEIFPMFFALWAWPAFNRPMGSSTKLFCIKPRTPGGEQERGHSNDFFLKQPQI